MQLADALKCETEEHAERIFKKTAANNSSPRYDAKCLYI
jgi:hypothetical protein